MLVNRDDLDARGRLSSGHKERDEEPFDTGLFGQGESDTALREVRNCADVVDRLDRPTRGDKYRTTLHVDLRERRDPLSFYLRRSARATTQCAGCGLREVSSRQVTEALTSCWRGWWERARDSNRPFSNNLCPPIMKIEAEAP